MSNDRPKAADFLRMGTMRREPSKLHQLKPVPPMLRWDKNHEFPGIGGSSSLDLHPTDVLYINYLIAKVFDSCQSTEINC